MESSRTCPSDVLAQGDHQEGIRWLVLRGPFESPCAYVGIPIDSPAAGLNSTFLDETGPQVHGGWSFNAAGDGAHRPEGWYWWGWDYAHWRDWTSLSQEGDQDHRWTVDEVVAEVRDMLPDFEAWLRSHPERRATAEAYKGRPTVEEVLANFEAAVGSEAAARLLAEVRRGG